MPRSIWSGAISFGLVNVPVKVVTAVRRQPVRFHQLHDEDGVRIQQKRICPTHGDEVSWDHIVKGYEVAPDEYVIVTPEELDALDPKRTRTIDIEEFVALDEIDPIYFDQPYVLVPDTGGAKPYVLLARAMREAGQVAIARVVLRSKEHLVALRPYGEGIAMLTLNYAEEIVGADAVEGMPSADVEVSDREVKMAEQLIGSLTARFDPTKYRDTWRDRVMALIESKAAGRETVVQPSGEARSPVIDLMAALEQSIAASKASRDSSTTTAKPKPKAKRPAAREKQSA